MDYIYVVTQIEVHTTPSLVLIFYGKSNKEGLSNGWHAGPPAPHVPSIAVVNARGLVSSRLPSYIPNLELGTKMAHRFGKLRSNELPMLSTDLVQVCGLGLCVWGLGVKVRDLGLGLRRECSTE